MDESTIGCKDFWKNKKIAWWTELPALLFVPSYLLLFSYIILIVETEIFYALNLFRLFIKINFISLKSIKDMQLFHKNQFCKIGILIFVEVKIIYNLNSFMVSNYYFIYHLPFEYFYLDFLINSKANLIIEEGKTPFWKRERERDIYIYI